MNIILATSYILLTISPLIAERASAANVIVGDCGQINQNISVDNFSTVTIVSNCGEQKPEDSFAVSYYWLDSLSLSFLMGGYVDKYMGAVLGEQPIIVRNSVHNNIKIILDKFGERLSSSDAADCEGGFARFGLYNPYIVGRSRNDSLAEIPLCDIPQRLRKGLRIYDGEAKIIWPDMDAFNAFYRSDIWPKGYSMSYRPGFSEVDILTDFANDRVEGARSALTCATIYKFLGESEFRNYWSNVSDIVKRIGHDDVPYNYSEGGDIKHTPAGSISNFKSYEAVRYFARHNWPNDYIFAMGRFGYSPCGDSAGLMLDAFPRDLFALVAVIRSRSPALRVSGLEYKVDPQEALRSEIVTSETRIDQIELPELAPGQTAVVPLRIELRYDLDSLPTEAEAEDSARLYDQIRQLPIEAIELDTGKTYESAIYFEAEELVPADASKETKEAVTDEGQQLSVEGLPKLTKRIGSFPAPTPLVVTQRYVYGEALDLAFVAIGGGSYRVRKTPNYAFLSEGGFDGGSCPFLYFREADGRLSLHGRVLVGANAKHRSRTEEVRLSEGATSIILSEKEPEISRIAFVEYFGTDNAEGVEVARDLVAQPGTDVEIELPEPAPKGARIKITGYYETVEDLFLSGSAIPVGR